MLNRSIDLMLKSTSEQCMSDAHTVGGISVLAFVFVVVVVRSHFLIDASI